jgi:hypothetical protein
MYKFPNRTGESALYKTDSPDYLQLSNNALPNMRTFAQAQADGSLVEGAIVGVSIVGPTGWSVWQAEFNETDGYLVQLSAETGHGILANDDVCDVVACITEAQMLEVFDEQIILP